MLEFDDRGVAVDIHEKPASPPSGRVVPGVYVYGREVLDLVDGVEPSHRGELEITDLNRLLLRAGELRVECLDEDVFWLDLGTASRLREGNDRVSRLCARDREMAGYPHLAALRQGWIDETDFAERVAVLAGSEYAASLLRLQEQTDGL